LGPFYAVFSSKNQKRPQKSLLSAVSVSRTYYLGMFSKMTASYSSTSVASVVKVFGRYDFGSVRAHRRKELNHRGTEDFASGLVFEEIK
jgi:hypothetical protein